MFDYFRKFKIFLIDLKMCEIVRIQKFGVVTVSRWDATMNGAVRRSVAENNDSLFKFFINSCCSYSNSQLYRKITLYFKIQNSACLSMELLPTNFIHYLLEWIVNSRIHIMDFSIWSSQRCCRSVSSTCDSQMCVRSLLNLCEKIRTGDFNLIKWLEEVWRHCSIRTGSFYFRVEMIWSGKFDFRVDTFRLKRFSHNSVQHFSDWANFWFKPSYPLDVALIWFEFNLIVRVHSLI